MTTFQQTVVLLVEDDEQTRELYRDALYMAGFSVLIAADGVSALQIVERHTPDALVIDVGLPLMSGTEVIEELHVSELTRGFPIVIVTGMTIERPPDVAALLTKPIDPYHLVQEVRKVIRRGRRASQP